MLLSLRTMEEQIKGDQSNKRFRTVQVYCEYILICSKHTCQRRSLNHVTDEFPLLYFYITFHSCLKQQGNIIDQGRRRVFMAELSSAKRAQRSTGGRKIW